MNDEQVDWKAVSMALAQRINYMLGYCKPNMKTNMLNLETREVTSGADYVADALEMIPNVKVDREMLAASPAERKKLKAQRESISLPNTEKQT